MKSAGKGGEVTGVVTVSKSSPGSSFRELDDVFLQTQARIWLGEVLHVRFDEDTSMADLIADGELLFQVSKLIWKMLVKKHTELKSSKLHVHERTSSGKSEAKYLPYPKVDSFFKICQILGLTGIDLFSPSDVVERRDTRRVCMCIRSLSIKARSKNLNVPDFDVVTYTIVMPKYVVGGICRNFLERSRCSSSNSSVNSRGSYRKKSLSGNSDQYQEPHYDSDEAESCLTEMKSGILISCAQFDEPHSFDLDGSDLLEESVNDKRSSLPDEDSCSENSHAISTDSPRLSAVYLDSSNSSAPMQNENLELNTEVISGVNHVSLSGDSWQSLGQDGDLTPQLNLAEMESDTLISRAQFDHPHSYDLNRSDLLEESVDDKRLSLSDDDRCSENSHEISIDSPRLSAVHRDGSNSNAPMQNENLELNTDVTYGDNHVSLTGDSWQSLGQDGDLTPQLNLAANENLQENSTENSSTRMSNGESSCTRNVAAALDNEFEFEKSEDNFTQELYSNLNASFSDSIGGSRLSREGRAFDLNSEVISSHFEEKSDGSKLSVCQSLTIDSESTSESIDYEDSSLQEINTIEAGDELECEEVMKQCEDKLVSPVELCEKETTPKEVQHTGHKVLTSVVGGITVMGVLLIFFQLRKKSNKRNHMILLQSKIHNTKEKEETVKRNVGMQKPTPVYPRKWLKL